MPVFDSYLVAAALRIIASYLPAPGKSGAKISLLRCASDTFTEIHHFPERFSGVTAI
jgi:hypothetical protein